jgi:pseudaminic acid synthase
MINSIFSIEGRQIGAEFPPYLVAELSANHNGSIDKALELISVAKRAGADAIKIQTYRPDTITIDASSPDFTISEGLWAGRTLYSLYEWAHTPWEWHPRLFTAARREGITLFSSPFDRTAVDFLEDQGCPAYKIASFEAVDTQLIKYVASTRKPMIISTGLASAEEICQAVEAAQSNGCSQLALLHCVSSYPAPAAEYNLRTIADMADRFGVTVGLSDHTLDNATAIAAVALGASVVEKHFTMDRNAGGPDDSFSLLPGELAALCRDARTAWEALGKVDYSQKPSEAANIKFRRSLYFVRDLAPGEVISEDAIRSVRPGYGVTPANWERVVGRRVRKATMRNTPVKLEDLMD